MSKDVILDKYARLYEIPNQLALLGHEVTCFCLSYQAHGGGRWDETNEEKSLVWHSKSYKNFNKINLWSYPFYLLNQLKQFQPDVIIAASDIPHIAIGAWCARQLAKPFVADLYDNFEGFGQAKIPGMKSLLCKSVRQAQLIITTSQPLADLVKDSYKATGKIISLPSTVDLQIFQPKDKLKAREYFSLAPNKYYIGTAGGLYRDKGIEVIYQAWQILKDKVPNVELVLAGPYPEDFPPPLGERVHYLGSLAHEEIATLFQALDVGIISILDTPFGRYCFPQKAYEMLACDLLVVAANIGEMGHLFADYPQVLFEAGNAADLAHKLQLQLNQPMPTHLAINDWKTIIQHLEPLIKEVVKYP